MHGVRLDLSRQEFTEELETLKDKTLIVGESVLFDDVSLFVGCILIDVIQSCNENSWDLSNLFQREREDESMVHIFDDQGAEEFFVDRCVFMVSKLNGFVDVDGLLLVGDF